MSGGRFNYSDRNAKNEIYGWANEPSNVFEDREISELIWDVFNLIHSFDWYQSGDTCKADYLKDKDKFKKKWLGNNRGLRIKRIIDETIEEAKNELYESFGIKEQEE